jgi:hypothetical protein
MFLALLVLIVVGVAVVRVLRERPGSAIAVTRVPSMLREAGVIEDGDVRATDRVVRRLVSWRFRGAMIGAGFFVLLAWAVNSAAPLIFVAILAGAISGVGAAEWWRAARTPDPIRTAGLQRRTITSLVGRTPEILLGTVLLVAAVTTTVWVAKQPPNGDWTVASGNWTCSTHINMSWSGQVVAWAAVIVTVVIALGAALAVTRRAADQTLPKAADLALRAASIRIAFGGAITVAGLLAAYSSYECRAALLLRQTVQASCATTSSTDQVLHVLLGVVMVGCVVIAIAGLVGFTYYPARRVPAENRMSV